MDNFDPEQPNLFTNTLQVAFVVKDLEQTMEVFQNAYGIGPWVIYDFNRETCTNMQIEEKPAEYAMRCGAAMLGNVQWELIQPLDDKSIYSDFLSEKGEGVHHVALSVPDYDATLDRLRKLGHHALQSGTFHGTTFTYFSTEDALKIPIELYSGPLPQIEPDGHYPPRKASSDRVQV